jgi:hypothetical protein
MLILKIIFFKKIIILIHFQIKNTLKSKLLPLNSIPQFISSIFLVEKSIFFPGKNCFINNKLKNKESQSPIVFSLK